MYQRTLSDRKIPAVVSGIFFGGGGGGGGGWREGEDILFISYFLEYTLLNASLKAYKPLVYLAIVSIIWYTNKKYI